MRKAHIVIAGVLALAMLALVATRQPTATPTSVAVVDIFRLVENLDMYKAHAAEMEAIQAELQAELDVLAEELKAKEQEMQDLVLPEGEMFERRVEIAELDARAVAKARASELILEFEYKRRWSQRYSAIVEASQALAQELGYDLVLVRMDNTSFGGLPNVETVPREQLTALMRIRDMLYVNDAIDITDQLITRMNNEFAAGGADAP